MAAPSRARQVRQRRFTRLRHTLTKNIFANFLAVQSARLLSSATARTCTFANATDIVSSTAHGFVTGKGPILLANSGGALPTGLSATTNYYPIVIDANSFKLALTRRDSGNGVAVDFTTDGTGTNTALYSVTPQSIMRRMRQRVKFNTIRTATDIDNL